MEIKKHGKKYQNKDGKESFVCEKCGCEFTAKEDDYYKDGNCSITTNSLSNYLAYSSCSYICSCPECHKIVKKTVSSNDVPLTYCGTSSTITTNTVTPVTNDTKITCNDSAGETVTTMAKA